MVEVSDPLWFEFVESKIFSKQIREVGGVLLTRMQSDLVQNPERGAVVKGTQEFAKLESLILRPGAVRAGVIDIFTFTLNTPAEFTCSTCSAKESKRTCRRSRSKSSER